MQEVWIYSLSLHIVKTKTEQNKTDYYYRDNMK